MFIEILSYLAYLFIGGLIGFGIKSLLDCNKIEEDTKKLNQRLDDWQKLEEERNKKKYH